MNTCILVGAAPVNEEILLALTARSAVDALIAVDGGYDTLMRLGLRPTLALGDFDSLGYVPEDVKVEAFSSIKDESDMELALRRAGASFETLIIFGALGGRLDHTVANLQLFSGYAEKGCRIVAVGEDQAVRFLAGPASLTLPAGLTGVVSVFAMGDTATGVTETGLYYGLDRAALSNRTSRGLSNELLGKPAHISIEAGTVAVFYPVEALVRDERGE